MGQGNQGLLMHSGPWQIVPISADPFGEGRVFVVYGIKTSLFLS